MNTLLQHIEWLEKRVSLSATDKDYVIFIMQEYARKHHENKPKNTGRMRTCRNCFYSKHNNPNRKCMVDYGTTGESVTVDSMGNCNRHLYPEEGKLLYQ